MVLKILELENEILRRSSYRTQKMMRLEQTEQTASKISDRAEDYLRIIHKIINQQGFARLSDVALELNVKPASAFGMLAKLQRQDLIVRERYGKVKLTETGLALAEVNKKRCDTVRKFLELLLVPHEIAVIDAGTLEHKLNCQTMVQFTKFVDFMSSQRPEVIKLWKEMFKCYCDSRKHHQNAC